MEHRGEHPAEHRSWRTGCGVPAVAHSLEERRPGAGGAPAAEPRGPGSARRGRLRCNSHDRKIRFSVHKSAPRSAGPLIRSRRRSFEASACHIGKAGVTRYDDAKAQHHRRSRCLTLRVAPARPPGALRRGAATAGLAAAAGGPNLPEAATFEAVKWPDPGMELVAPRVLVGNLPWMANSIGTRLSPRTDRVRAVDDEDIDGGQLGIAAMAGALP